MSSLKRKAGDLPASDPKKPKQQGTLTSFFGAPKAAAVNGASKSGMGGASAAAPEVAAPKFEKDKWLAKLTDEQRRLLKMEIETLDNSWLALLKDEVTSKEFLDLKRFLEREEQSGKKIFPPKEDVYSWFVLSRTCLLSHAFPPLTLSLARA